MLGLIDFYYFIVQYHLQVLFITACSSNCNGCSVNGAGLCDPGYCKTGYVYIDSSKLCSGLFYMI